MTNPKGTRFETPIANYLAKHVDDRIMRRRLSGKNDRGDIGGVRIIHGRKMVLELKNYVKTHLGVWYGQAERERGNDDAECCAVIHKRHGKGQPGDQWVTMTVDDLIALLTGERPGRIEE